MYTLVSTLSGHRNSINTVQFSPDGAYLVSGSEDGLLLIHTVNSWQLLLRFVSPSPITSLVWHPKLERVLFCGCKNGDVHRIQFSASGENVRMWANETRDQIHCMVHHNKGNLLAIGCGGDVFVMTYDIRKEGNSSWTVTSKTLLPPPPKFSGFGGFLPSPVARSISFLKANRLLVAYLEHGVVCWDLTSLALIWHITPRGCRIGRAAVSPSGTKLAVTNLFDGVDLYSLTDQSRLGSISVDMKENVSAAVTFVDEETVAFGGGSGHAYIAKDTPLAVRHALRHDDGDLIQALASFTPRWGKTLLVTGVSELQEQTVVRVWEMDHPDSVRSPLSPVQIYVLLALICLSCFAWWPLQASSTHDGLPRS